jgi:cardiolipin synthase
MSIVFLPYIGALLFLFFGMNRVKRRQRTWWRHRRSRERRRRRSDDAEQAEPQLSRLQERLTDLTKRATDFGATAGNRIVLLPEPQDAFAAIIRAIDAAEQSVHVQYYIYRPDRIGTRIRDALIRKARDGVRVRFMYDGIGSWRLSRNFLKPMRDTGIVTSPFLPGRSFRERWSINLRNHRKLVIVDDRIAFTGGLNVGDEYLGRDPAWGYWRDTQMQLEGPVVRQLIDVFMEDWYCATDERVPAEQPPNRFPDGVRAQVIADGPDLEMRPLRSVLLAAILEAERSITISTGYFVPTQTLQDALCTAAQRGVKVRLLVAGAPTYWYTLWAGRSFYAELLNLGVEIYEYAGGLFHAKVLTIDDSWSLVGTPNFDFRSLDLNFEVAVAMSDERIAAALKRQFAVDLGNSRRVDADAWSCRSMWRVRGENFCRLFGPLL